MQGASIWGLKLLAPWAVGGVLLVSFTASAGPRLDDFDAPLKRYSTLRGGTVLKLPVPRAREAAAGDELRGAMSGATPAATPAATPLSLLFGHDGEDAPRARFLPAEEFRTKVAARAGVFFADVAVGDLPTQSDAVQADRSGEGATPPLALAVGLRTSTPSLADPPPTLLAAYGDSATPQNISRPASRSPLIAAASSRYSDLIDPEDMSREQRCLAQAIYFEARSEPAEGQAAVAQVVLNRVKSGLYPDSVCGVVYQNRHRYLGCQFTFACEGRSLRITEAGPWRQAVRIARAVTFGQTYLHSVGDATHYHARYVRPGWSRLFSRKDAIGQHVFYRPRPGQS